MTYISPEVTAIKTANSEALDAALHNRFGNQADGAHELFKDAQDTVRHADATGFVGSYDVEHNMAASDTLRDWAMTYARDAARIEITDDIDAEIKAEKELERRQLFDAAEYVIDLAEIRAKELPNQSLRYAYANKYRAQKGKDTFYIAGSVRTRIQNLRSITESTNPEQNFNDLYEGLGPGYWQVTAAAEPLRAGRAGINGSEGIRNNAIFIPKWIGRTVLSLTRAAVANREPIYDAVQATFAAERAAKEELSETPWHHEAAVLAKVAGAALKATISSRKEFVQAGGHVARAFTTLRSRHAAKSSIIAHP